MAQRTGSELGSGSIFLVIGCLLGAVACSGAGASANGASSSGGGAGVPELLDGGSGGGSGGAGGGGTGGDLPIGTGGHIDPLPAATGGADGGSFAGTDHYWTDGKEEAVPAGSRSSAGGSPGGPIFGPGFGGASSGAGGATALGGSAGTLAGVGGGSGAAGGAGSVDAGSTQIPPGQLTAGEWNDREHWDFWKSIWESQTNQSESWFGSEATWGFHTRDRFSVLVGSAEAPAVDTVVRLLAGDQSTAWQGRTDVDGRADLFANMFAATPGPYRLVAGTGAESVALDVAGPNGEAPVTLALEGVVAPPPSLDLAFLVDTTGSMGDELSYIQSELLDVIARVRAASSNEIDLRLSVDFYRDTSDDYVVRSYPFTADVQVAVDALKLQSANGGGDTPEAMDRALEVAVEQLEWRPSATARVLFLVCDAPPHSEPDVVARVRTQVRSAAEKGIRIIPVSGSGIDKETEFLLRFIDIATGGTYAFLTDDSGIGGAHLDPHPTIGPYTVELLNDLMVRLVRARLGG